MSKPISREVAHLFEMSRWMEDICDSLEFGEPPYQSSELARLANVLRWRITDLALEAIEHENTN